MTADEKQDTLDSLQEAISEIVAMVPNGQREEAKGIGNEAWGFVEELTAEQLAVIDRAEPILCGCGLNEPCRKCWDASQS
jgi:hypothetical protein